MANFAATSLVGLPSPESAIPMVLRLAGRGGFELGVFCSAGRAGAAGCGGCGVSCEWKMSCARPALNWTYGAGRAVGVEKVCEWTPLRKWLATGVPGAGAIGAGGGRGGAVSGEPVGGAISSESRGPAGTGVLRKLSKLGCAAGRRRLGEGELRPQACLRASNW